MRRLRVAVLFSLLAISSIAHAAPRRRVIAKPSTDPAPAAWLTAHATAIESTELAGPSRDLEPLRALAGSSSLVALGDLTHGTHEIFTLKLRLIDFFVRELNFDTLAIEAPFPLTNELDAYIHGSVADPRAILHRAGALNYAFWNTEEFLAVVEWLRAYNLSHDAQVSLAGFDIYDEATAQANVIAYYRHADPALASAIEAMYANGGAEAVHAQLASRRADFEPLGSSEYADALQNATVVVQRMHGVAETRDVAMAENALWIRQHRSRNSKVLLWAHQEHLGRSATYVGWPSMGQLLAAQVSDYFVIGHLAGSGMFLQSIWDSRTQAFRLEPRVFRPVLPDSYEATFREAHQPRILVSLHGNVPSWLQGPAQYRSAGSSPNPNPDWERSESLPQKLDAVIYLDETSAARPLR